jgi:hypothetical protein
VVPTLENGGPTVVDQVQERWRTAPAGGHEPPMTAGGGPSSGAGRWSSNRLVEEPSGSSGRARWVGDGG